LCVKSRMASYSSQHVAKIVSEFERVANKMVANKSKTAMLAAAEINVLKSAEVIRDVCAFAVKDSSAEGREQLVLVFGGSCEKIGRLLAVLNAINGSDFSGDNANDSRWDAARDTIFTIKAILEEMGLFRIWYPGKELLAPENISLKGFQERFDAGERIQISVESEGGDPNEFSLDKDLPVGLRFDRRRGHIVGKCDFDVADLFSVAAANDVGICTLGFWLRVGPPAPTMFWYSVPSDVRAGREVEWKPEFNGLRCNFVAVEPLPKGLLLDASTGAISGSLKSDKDNEKEAVVCKIQASNIGGSLETSFDFYVVKVDVAERICNCTDLAKLWKMEPKRKKKVSANWMIWMVHRAHLDDHTLTELNFTGMLMPAPDDEPRIIPKLMQAMQTNTHLKEMHLAGSRLPSSQGPALAAALRQNETLRVLNIETNHLDVEAIHACTKALSQNASSNLEEWRFNNQAGIGSNFGVSTEEAIAQMLTTNRRLLKVGLQVQNAAPRNSIDRSLMQNADALRRRRSAGA